MNKLKNFLLLLLSLTVIGGAAVACGETETPDNGGEPGIETPDTPETDPEAEELAAMGEIVKAAYELAQGATMEGTHTIKGVITNVKELGDGEACVTIAVKGFEEYPMYCYWLKGAEAGSLAVGDTITVTGTIKNYKGTVEFEKPTLDAVIKGERPELVVTTTPGTGIAEGYDVITIEMAKEICAYTGEVVTEDRYYIQATVDTVTNAKYGEMYIYDETGSIKVYGTYSEDGSIGYEAMTDKPFKGAEVLLSCTLHAFGNDATPEVKNARVIAFENVEFNESDYTEMTMEEARAAVDGTMVKVEGVVAQITYASGYVPEGVYVVDGTGATYIYDRDVAGRVKVGNTISVAGKKAHWIRDEEKTNAAKFGYTGCNQIEDAWLLENDGLESAWDKSWVDETTVKAVMETPFTTDITATIFKANAVIKEVEGTDFTNFYIDDLDETTGSYCYSKCNGGDYTWLREYDDGCVYTVYFSVINAKSEPTGCIWRLVPIAVGEKVTVDKADAPKFFVEYFGVNQFEAKYTANPELALTTEVSSNVYGVSGTLSYASSNTEVATVEGGVLNLVAYGNVTITVTATTEDGTYSATVDITFEEPPKIEFITVAEAIATAPDTEGIIVKGIVGPSLVNQAGFYLFGEDGSMIAVKVSNKDEAFVGLSIGNEVFVQGMRERYVNNDSAEHAGQTCIVNAVILQNNFGNYEYSTAKFVTGKTVADLYALDKTVDHSTTVFVVTGKIVFPTGNGQVSINADGASFGFYAGSVSQYEFLRQFEGQEVTIEVAACNWNNKGYWRGCVLAVRLADGTKILNTLNFN